MHLSRMSRLIYRLTHFKSIRQMQLTQNSASGPLTKTSKMSHITPVLRSLQWLPVCQKTDFRILLLVYKALNVLICCTCHKIIWDRSAHCLQSQGLTWRSSIWTVKCLFCISVFYFTWKPFWVCLFFNRLFHCFAYLLCLVWIRFMSYVKNFELPCCWKVQYQYICLVLTCILSILEFLNKWNSIWNRDVSQELIWIELKKENSR